MNTTNNIHLSITAEELETHLLGYDQIKLLATGGMGAVYTARQKSLDRTVAIKVLTHSFSFSLQFRQIFKQEAKVMAKLSNPSLVSIYDYGEINGLLYIVMGYIKGRTLHEVAHQKQVAHQEAAQLIIKIAEALTHAHRHGILHRDIKPANIIIDENANPVLIDFGLSHHRDDSTAKGGTVFGTDGYTAPEILLPPYRADQRADVFSLGILFYELVTGTLPEEVFISPSHLAPVDSRYDAVIKKSISTNLEDRHLSTQQFAEDMRKASTTEPKKLSSWEDRAVKDNSKAPLSATDQETEVDTVPKTEQVSSRQSCTQKSLPKSTKLLILLTLIGIVVSVVTISHALKTANPALPVSTDSP
ncbi:MAG: serine/threonine-protein kinase [Akkermansiaceae bacterium]